MFCKFRHGKSTPLACKQAQKRKIKAPLLVQMKRRC
jgi:hypothetical protein